MTERVIGSLTHRAFAPIDRAMSFRVAYLDYVWTTARRHGGIRTLQDVLWVTAAAAVFLVLAIANFLIHPAVI